MRLVTRKLSRREHLRLAYRDHFEVHRRERQFISTTGFFLAFGVARAVTHAIKAGKGPFHDIGGDGGTHIHHMTFGIIGNLIVGYLWVVQFGTNQRPSPLASRLTSFVFGAGSALTLDEFALWLNLEDDYWTSKGRESIDAVVVFGTLLALGALGGGVFRKYFERLENERRRTPAGKALAALRERERHMVELLAG